MGRRGPGAKPKASRKTGDIMSGGQPKHRKVLPLGGRRPHKT